MSDDLLRRAAAKLREHAEKASVSAWAEPERDDNPGDEGWWIHNGRQGMSEYAVAVTPLYSPRAEADARFIALMCPPVALALADLLDEHARGVDARIQAERHVGVPEGTIQDHEERFGLTLARAILREPS